MMVVPFPKPTSLRGATAAWRFWRAILPILFAACSPTPQTQADARAPQAIGTLRNPSELGADFQWRQQVTAHWPDGTRSFDAILSKEGGTLLLVGLGPMDTPGFVLRLDATRKLTVENRTERPIPFDPKFVLLDVQRAFYPWFRAPLVSGERTTTVDDEIIAETWRDGTLSKRVFTRVSGEPPGELVVKYEGWTAGNRAPRRATLHNAWFGYTLTIETVEQSELD